MPTKCVVPTCKNYGGHVFPKDPNLRKKWIQAVQRHDRWRPSKYTVICTKHFKESDFETTSVGMERFYKTLKKDVVPSVFESTKKDTIVVGMNMETNAHETIDTKEHSSTADNNSNVPETRATKNIGTQTVDISEPKCQCSVNMDNAGFGIHKFVNDNKAIDYYTGLETYEKFEFVFRSLCPDQYALLYIDRSRPKNITCINCFFLTLIVLRRKMPLYELSLLFEITEYDVSSVFLTWITFMDSQWRELDVLPSHERVRFYAPKALQAKFPSTQMHLNGTEIPIQKPNPSTSATYKTENTVEVAAGITRGGLISFVSEVYGGPHKTRTTVQRSCLGVICDIEHPKMIDTHFNMKDLMGNFHVKIDIPWFFTIKCNLPSKCMHIERVFELSKTFKILTTPLNDTENLIAGKIIFVCFMLSSLQRHAVNNGA